MPRFRYQATSKNGAPIYGSEDAGSEEALRLLLASRGQRLSLASVVSFDPSISLTGRRIPRLAQLRLGAQLREALLTDLPAHQAVRAMAAEPFQHPLLSLLPWTLGLGGLLVILSNLGIAFLTSLSTPLTAWKITAATLAIQIIVFATATWLLDRRPRKFLRLMADRLEAGEQEINDLLPLLPNELREVMRANTSEQCRARAVAELVPSLAGTRLQRHRFAFSIFGPLLLCATIFLGLYAMMIFVIPDFVRIFTDFATEMPGLTIAVANLSRMLQAGGALAYWSSCVVVATALVLAYILILNQQVAEFFSTIPVFGVPFRWLMQARVARVLGALVRHGSSGAEAVRAATAASGFDVVRKAGEEISHSKGNKASSPYLSALPLSLILNKPTSESGTADHREESIAQSLTSFANMLEHASEGHGRLIGLIVQSVAIVFGGVMTALIVLALFLPLISLLNNLA